ncbi:sulfite exporter TauE/SafE family protein [Sphingobacterium olei]|uniref:Sulfite exporter TauE/SafE family protein n=1 Tax=Sphingobacterium olei TaxID=2571155 RepID=A0A4U0NA61_9SPHI|nr:sulfite exporter TauE/SafE family protein [Sphingobacterium olei]TJZ50785.1 sulfite exporter TauE/SafE family protein [Sphingobacterium olei]
MTYHYLAFFMGLFGSIHCVVMCGPLLVAIQGNQRISWRQTFNKLLHQTGRILTYGCIGLLVGLFGSLAALQGWQEGFSVITGAILIVIGLFYFVGKKSIKLARLQTRAIQPLARVMGKWLYKPGGAFIAGILNGILPCGMVYMALASAMNADQVMNSFWFMVLFGLGTLPLMFTFSFATSLPKSIFKMKFVRIIPFLYLLMGMWFLLRGANLDIPYLSPLIHIEGALNCM